MHSTQHHFDSQLFIMRLWQEADAEGKEQWCGKVQHVLSGQAQKFCGWQNLIELLQLMGVSGEASGLGAENQKAVTVNKGESA